MSLADASTVQNVAGTCGCGHILDESTVPSSQPLEDGEEDLIHHSHACQTGVTTDVPRARLVRRADVSSVSTPLNPVSLIRFL